MQKLVFIFLLLKIPAVAQLNADFSASVVKGCSPLVVQFTDLSTGDATSWFWDFGNGTTSSLQNPVATYTAGGNYSVRLIIKNASGQNYEQKNNYITVYTTPEAGFYISSGDSGCAPLQTAFKDSSNSLNTTISTWLWDFDDGTSSTLQNPLHTYSSTGRYNVLLTIQTTEGCTDKQIRNRAVITGNKPVAAFSATPLNGCASAFRNFQNKSSGNITASAWTFGDGGISYDKNPQYHYQDTGIFSVKLKVSDNGCEDSIIIPKYVRVDGPVAKFLTRINCDDRFALYFYDRSIDGLSRQWDFGDNTTSVDPSPIHNYASRGIYITSLIIKGAACADTAKDTIHIKATTPVIEVSPVKSFYCKYDSLEFSVKNYDTADIEAFIWNFDDGILKGTTNLLFYIFTTPQESFNLRFI